MIHSRTLAGTRPFCDALIQKLKFVLILNFFVEMNISLSPFAPEKLASRDGFGCSVLRQPAHSLHSS